MLLKLNVMRLRSQISAINDQQELELSIHPEVNGGTVVTADARMVNDDLDYASLKVGQKLDVLVTRYAEDDGSKGANGQINYKKDRDGHVVFQYVAVGIEKIQVHPFDIETLHPKGLRCLTATVNQAAEGADSAIIAKSTADGQENFFRITNLTKMFQAQADEELRSRIYNGLKNGNSVNIWVDPNASKTLTDDIEPIEVTNVEFLSVNFQ